MESVATLEALLSLVCTAELVRVLDFAEGAMFPILQAFQEPKALFQPRHSYLSPLGTKLWDGEILERKR
jgi:hypothetical protein